MSRDRKERRTVPVGSRIGGSLTVLNAVDDRGREPVYIAWDHRRWCPVACKAATSARQAQREADILSALSHPNIVRCYGIVDSTHLLMEYLEGPTLAGLIRGRRRRRLGVSDALRVAIYIAAALNHTHERGFLHMDIKTSNVVVVHGRPVLCDFGIARRQADPRPEHVHGTDAYISPEECRREKITPAADVFGLGVTLYELLTGKLPFPDGPKEAPFTQLTHTPLSVRRHRRSVPAPLDALVLRCLAVDPAARPTLAALIPALHDFIRNGPAMWPAGFQPDAAEPAPAIVPPEPAFA